MSSTTSPATRSLASVAALLLAATLGGCSVSKDDEPDAAPRSETRTTPTDEPTPTPTPTPSPAAEPSPIEEPTPASTPTAASTAAPAGSIEDALLTAAELPRLNDTSRWSEGRTGAVRPVPFGLCQRFDLLSIGATEGIDRAFTARGDSAGQQVVEFADAQTAARATKVVQAWRRDCATRVRGVRRLEVRPFTDVAVTSGRGSWYLASYRRGGRGHFHSLGMVVNGTRMTLLRMDHTGQDHNYEPGQDPMERAVKAAAAKLG